jgi:hypothetical protein
VLAASCFPWFVSAVWFRESQVAGDNRVTFPVTAMLPPVRYNRCDRSEKDTITVKHVRSDAINNDYGGSRRLARVTLLPAVAAVAVLVTACGSSPSASSTGRSAFYPKALSYSKCMRAHGVPNFPDPNAQGNIVAPAGSEDDSNPVFAAAHETCQPLLSSRGQTTKAKSN